VKQQEPMLHATGLRLGLGGREIFNIADLAVHKGEVLALVGPNGAGK
jgi:ABC-type cobalamin/Fe3+-siderophores transport system ATPase subunit